MITSRDEKLIAGVNLKLERRRRQARWWWLAGCLEVAGLVVAYILLFWIWRSFVPEAYWFFYVGGGTILLVFFFRQTVRAMNAKIGQLESRIAQLEGMLPSNDQVEATPAEKTNSP